MLGRRLPAGDPHSAQQDAGDDENDEETAQERPPLHTSELSRGFAATDYHQQEDDSSLQQTGELGDDTETPADVIEAGGVRPLHVMGFDLKQAKLINNRQLPKFYRKMSTALKAFQQAAITYKNELTHVTEDTIKRMHLLDQLDEVVRQAREQNVVPARERAFLQALSESAQAVADEFAPKGILTSVLGWGKHDAWAAFAKTRAAFEVRSTACVCMCVRVRVRVRAYGDYS
jgi:hypothetical protein